MEAKQNNKWSIEDHIPKGIRIEYWADSPDLSFLKVKIILEHEPEDQDWRKYWKEGIILEVPMEMICSGKIEEGARLPTKRLTLE